jgi:hypothetical protein
MRAEVVFLPNFLTTVIEIQPNDLEASGQLDLFKLLDIAWALHHYPLLKRKQQDISYDSSLPAE